MSATETIEVVVHHELAPGTHAQILEAITSSDKDRKAGTDAPKVFGPTG